MSEIADFHSHILPGIDDGSGSVIESISLLRREAEQGISHVVAPPTFTPDMRHRRNSCGSGIMQKRYFVRR